MSIRMNKPWQPLTAETVRRLTGQLGVYQLADRSGVVVAVGYAGGRSLFGLRGELEKALADPPFSADRFRVEVDQQYLTRWQELLMVHVADHGELPIFNRGRVHTRLGRLSPL